MPIEIKCDTYQGESPSQPRRTLTNDLTEELGILMDISNVVNDILEKLDGGITDNAKEPCANEKTITGDITSVLVRTENIRDKINMINNML